MPVFNNILAGASGQTSEAAAGYQIDRSLRFNSGDAAHLQKVPSSTGNRKTWTWSCWFKRSRLSLEGFLLYSDVNGGNYRDAIRLESSDKLRLYLNGGVGASFLTDQVFRDPSSWYHLVIAVDTTQATASDRVKFYINGSQITSFSSATYPTQNYETGTFVSGKTARIGRDYSGNYFNGYLTDVHFIEGQALAATDFGEYDDNNNWNPKAFSGTYGTNGFHLDFSDNSSAAALGTDSSGNSNTWTVNNISVAAGADNDSLLDSPTNYDDGTNVGGNYCTWNPLDKATVTLANGNLDITAASTDHCVRGTIAVPESVKIYYEFTVTQRGGGGAQSPIVGVANTSFDLNTNPDSQTSTVWAYSGSGAKLGGGSTYTSYGSSLSANDVLGVAIDRSAGRIWFSLNGTWQNSGDPTDSTDTNAAFTNVPTTGTLFIFFGNNNGTPGLGVLNAGQRPFQYPPGGTGGPPSDYKSLCTTNLPTPTVADGSDYFDIATWSGNSSTQSITGLSFQPDFLWYKSLSAFHHALQDAVRGVGKSLSTSRIDIAEQTETTGLDTFTSDGFDLDGDGFYYINRSGQNFVGWAWNGGGSTASNTDGSITSSVRANQTAGFSIVSFTGTNANGTVGHGLNAKPSLYVVKNRDATSNNWFAFTDLIDGSNDYLYLNTTGSKNDAGLNYANVATSSVFYMGVESGGINTSGDAHIAYCFAPVEGYSAFGSYTGNSSSDGVFIYTGFRPAFVLIKTTNTASSWYLYDSARETYNAADTALFPNLSNAESTNTAAAVDLVSNGFKLRGNAGATNSSSNTYIYAAFAEHPFKTARAR